MEDLSSQTLCFDVLLSQSFFIDFILLLSEIHVLCALGTRLPRCRDLRCRLSWNHGRNTLSHDPPFDVPSFTRFLAARPLRSL